MSAPTDPARLVTLLREMHEIASRTKDGYLPNHGYIKLASTEVPLLREAADMLAQASAPAAEGLTVHWGVYDQHRVGHVVCYQERREQAEENLRPEWGKRQVVALVPAVEWDRLTLAPRPRSPEPDAARKLALYDATLSYIVAETTGPAQAIALRALAGEVPHEQIADLLAFRAARQRAAASEEGR